MRYTAPRCSTHTTLPRSVPLSVAAAKAALTADSPPMLTRVGYPPVKPCRPRNARTPSSALASLASDSSTSASWSGLTAATACFSLLVFQPSGHATPALRLAHAREHLEHVRHLARVVRRAPHVAQPQLVGLALVVARVLEKHDAERLARDAGVAPDVGARERAHGEAELG